MNKQSTKDFLTRLSEICNLKVKELYPIMEKIYEKGDEISIKDIIKKNIRCIHLDIFRYLILFVSSRQTKMKIYFYSLEANRMDLLSSIRGLTSIDYSSIYEFYRNSGKKEIKTLLLKEFNKARKREMDKKEKRKNSKVSLDKKYKTKKNV